MKVNFNVPILNLEGTPMMDGPSESNMGKSLGIVLVSGAKGDVLKFYDWAVKMHKGEELDLDRADQDLLKKFINDSEQLPIISKAQMLEKLTSPKESATA